MSKSHLGTLTRATRSCAAFVVAAAMWAAITPVCQAQGVPPPNDNIANAQALVGVSGTVYGTNLNATFQQNEPAPFPGSPAGSSIWYLWTAPISTTIDFKTRGSTTPFGSPLPTTLAVYRLASGKNVAFNNLILVAQNENDPTPGPQSANSRVDFQATLGTLYLIQVDGAAASGGANAQGYVTLTWAPSLIAGTFQFTSSVFQLGAADDILIAEENAELEPSLHNPAGANNGRITITRVGGSTGRCEMQLIVTNSFYTNLTINNVTGTNVFMTNLVDGVATGFTNYSTSVSVTDNQIANDLDGFITYFDNYTGFAFGDTNANGIPSFGGEETFPTNLPFGECLNETGPLFFTTNVVGTITNVLVTQTSVFCQWTTNLQVVPSAIDGEDYLSTDTTNIVFDDFQMSQDIYLNLPSGVGFFGFDGFPGSPPGPQYPQLYGANGDVMLILTNVVLDKDEDKDIIPPTISRTLGSATAEVLNLAGLPSEPFFTNFPVVIDFGTNVIQVAATVNFERETFRVNKPLTGVLSTNKIWVVRNPRYWDGASIFEYTMDTVPSDFGSATINWNHWTTVAGSDYAVPEENGLPQWDFTHSYTGVHGTLNFPGAFGDGWLSIDLVVTNDGAQEFDSDILLQLYETGPEFTGNANAMPPTFLGNISSAIATINFTNQNPGVQPGGAWDRTFNPDSAPNSQPPFNTLPGANAPVQSVAIQPNGQAVIAGAFTTYDNYTTSPYVARLDGKGFLDGSFSAVPDGPVDTVLVDSTGRIYIGGQFTSINGVNAFHIARLTPSGGLDTTFVTHAGFNANSTVWTMVLDTNGNLLVGGSFTNYNTTNCNHIVRLLPSGALDPSFKPSSNTPNTGADSDVHAIALDSNGNIVIGGSFNNVNSYPMPHIARLLPSGILDPSFNPGFGPDSTVYALAVEPNNFILLGGSFANYNLIPSGSIARLTSTGNLDPSFTPGTGANGTIYSILLQPNGGGEILIGGQFTSFNNTRRLGVARLFDSGWVDTSFLDTAYNQFAGFINHYYNVAAVNLSDTPAQFNSVNIVSSMGYDSSSNLVVGGSFTRVGGGGTRDEIHFQQNLTRLVLAPTPGPEPGGAGNNPGNIGLTLNNYSVGNTANKLFLTLDRLNGSLGPAVLTLGTNTLPPGPGAATDQDFGISVPVAEYHDIWDFWTIAPSGVYGWRKSDGYYGFNYQTDPVNFSDDGAAGLGLIIHNNLNATNDVDASLSLLNLNSVGLLTLGGQTIPTGPALGLPASTLEIVNNNLHGGTLGFSATNYTVVNTAGFVTITVLRTNGNVGLPVSVNYTLYPGFTNGAGTNVAQPNRDYNLPYQPPLVEGTLSFAAGETSESFNVPIVDQSILVPTRFFNIVLSNPSASALLDSNTPPVVPSTTVVEIIDGNFQPGHLVFSAPTYSVLKGSPATITVDRLGGALGQLSVNVGTSNGTALSGTNYVSTIASLVWKSQDVTPKTVAIPTIQDNIVEGAKTVNLSLFNALLAGSGPATSLTNQEILAYPSNAVLTIEDTDSYGTLNFSSANYNVLQNAGYALVTVTRTGGTVGAVSVNVATADGTNATTPFQPAYAGTNYSAITNTVLSFGPGVSSVSFKIFIFQTPGEAAQANRIFNLVLFNGSPGIAGQFPKTATVTILDNQLVLSPAGSVDQTIQNGSGFNNDVLSLSLQPDGSLLAGGDFTGYNNFPFNFFGRIFPDAAFDSAFQGVADSTVYQILSQAPNTNQVDGSIMIVGQFKQVDQTPRDGIARLNLNGSLDESFNPGAGADSTVYAIVQQFLPNVQTNLPSLAYYLIGGNFANFNGTPSSGLARLNATGQLDPTFNLGSGVTGTNAAVHAIALEPNNQILVAGDFTSFDNAAHHHLVRLNADGTVDASFAAFDGTNSDINGSIRAIQVQPDGNIIIGGLFTSVNGQNYNYIARLKNDGTLDTNFLVGVGCNNPVLALALDSQNRILVGGEFTRASGVTRNGITRLNPDGTVDPTINFGFGANGYVDSIVIETDDEIDIAGGFTTFNNIPENNYVRVYGGATAGDGSLEFSQQTYGVLEDGTNAIITIERLGGEGTTGQPTVSAQFYTSDTTNGLAGTNYGSVSTNIVFPYGETFETVVVPVYNTPAVAADAIVGLNLTNGANVAIGPQANAQLVITNIHAALEFSATGYRQSANAAVGYADIQVVRTGNPNSTVSVTASTVAYSGTNAAAAPGVNYTPVTTVLQFPTNTMTVDWLVPITNAPSQYEDLAVALQLNNPSNAIVGSPSSATLIIAAVNNSPGEIAFSQGNYAVSEAAGTALITLVRTNGSEGPVSAILTTSDGSAVSGVNYYPVTNLVNFAAGISSATVPIKVVQQTNAGPDVTVQMTLSNPQGGAILGSPSNSTLTIQNNLENFSMGAGDYFVNENVGTLTVSILRNGPATLPAAVNYTTFSPANADDANGFAVPNVDYVPVSGTLRFAAGVSLQTIPITIIQGNQVNGLESFQIVLSNPTGGAQLGSPASATVVITSDVTGFALATNSYIVGENGSNVVITVNRLNPNTGNASVRFLTSDNTAIAGQDYVAASGVLNFVTGQSTTNVTVQILNPNTVEPNKSFNVSLQRPSTNSYLVAPSNAVVIITNVNSGISFDGQLFTVSECSAEAAIPVVLTGVTNGRASVDYTTSDLSGKAGINYTPTSGTLYFTNGQNVQDFFVKVINNHVIGPDHTVQVTLSNPTNAQLLNPSTATLTIEECNGAFIVASGTAFVTGSENPGTGVIYPNETVTILFGLRDIAGGNTTNLVATLVQTNGVTNATKLSANYGVLVENGPTKSQPFTFQAVGTNGENITATLQLTDGARSLGTVAFGFTIGGTTYSFTNSQPLLIFGNGNAANPTPATNSLPPAFGYPTVINVSGVVGAVTAVTATLQNFTHSFPRDVNVLLEGPQGEDSVLMSHAGGSIGVQHLNLTFDQSASKFVPVDSTSAANAITSGTYLPTTNSTYLMGKLPQVPSSGSVPNAPQTPYPYLPNLGVFVGAVPNGTWALWVDDDDTLDQGYISNGWVLNISIGTQVENDSDLEVTFAPSTTNATLGNPLVYSLTLTNYGPSSATNVVISNNLPAGMTYVTNSCGCGVTINNGVLTVNYPVLTVGEGTAFTITMLPTELGYATNAVTASADEPDPNSNNSVVTSVLVSSPQADVGISISETPDPLLAGGLVTYIVVATNNGPSEATGTVATVALPEGFLVTTITPAANATNINGFITWNIGDLGTGPGNSSATLIIVARAMVGGTELATASISSGIYDPTKLNNSASAKTQVIQPMISVSVVNQAYTLTWPATASNFVLEGAFDLPPIGTWVPITPAPSIVDGQYSFTLPGATGYRFFRLSTETP